MRKLVLTVAAVAVLTSACTRHYKVRRGQPLPVDSTDHLMGAAQGAGIGVFVGGTLGAVVGYSGGDDHCEADYGCFLTTTARQKAMIVGVLGAASGAATGLVLGAIVGSKETYEYEDDRSPTITTSVTPGQFGTTAAWRF